MSASELLNYAKSWSDIKVKSISTNSANLNNGPITNVSSINGVPIPPSVFDLNPVNIIYKPGSSPSLGSNIVSSWSEVILKANRLNVNQCLNVFIDDSIQSPVLIDQSLDCKSRVRFLSYNSSTTSSYLKILDTFTLSDPYSFEGSLVTVCESVTNAAIILSNGSILTIKDGAVLRNNGDSLVPAIQINDANNNNIYLESGGQIDTQATVSLINVGISSLLNYTNITNISGQSYISNTISSTDNTSELILRLDSSVSVASIINPNFTGLVLSFPVDKAFALSYDDSLVNPQLSANNVQDAIDDLKSNYLNISNLSGTPNQIIVTTGSGEITLSTPQDINTTSSVQFGKVVVTAGSAAFPSIQVGSSAVGLAASGSSLILAAGPGNALMTLQPTNIQSSQPFYQIDGSVSSPAYSFVNDTSSGLYRISANDIGFSIGGSKILDISSSGMDVNGILQLTAQPHYYVTASTTQTIAYNTYNILTIWDTVQSSNNISYSSGTFTINISGTYSIVCNIQGDVSNNPFVAFIGINTQMRAFTVQTLNTLGTTGCTLSDVLVLSTSDIISIYVGNFGLVNVTTNIGPQTIGGGVPSPIVNTTVTSLSISMIG